MFSLIAHLTSYKVSMLLNDDKCVTYTIKNKTKKKTCLMCRLDKEV